MYSSNQSLTIDVLRFPLALAVVFIHMDPETVCLLDADFPMLSYRGVYNILGISISHVFANIAVPMFYVISGLLFFANMRDWSWSLYKDKMKRRLKTLLIPYLLWNFIVWMGHLFKIAVSVYKGNSTWESLLSYIHYYNWNVFIDCNVWGADQVNILGRTIYSTSPIDHPLWFLRDLIVVTVLSPVLYYLIKKTRLGFIFLLSLAYISRVWFLIPGFSITAFFFFSLGAYFSITGRELVRFSRVMEKFSIPLSIVLFAVCCVFDGNRTAIGANVFPFYIIVTVFAMFAFSSYFVERYDLKPCQLLVSSVFFIYAAHTVAIFIKWSPIGVANYMLHSVIPGASNFETILCYLLIPLLTTALCVSVYIALRGLFPRFTNCLNGSR